MAPLLTLFGGFRGVPENDSATYVRWAGEAWLLVRLAGRVGTYFGTLAPACAACAACRTLRDPECVLACPAHATRAGVAHSVRVRAAPPSPTNA
jgi:hypothetical protein